MIFKSRELRKIAEDNFGGIGEMHAALIKGGVSINYHTLTDWCYAESANPRVNQFSEVTRFLEKKKINIAGLFKYGRSIHTFEIEQDNLTENGELRNYEIEYDVHEHSDGTPYVEIYSAVDLLTGEIQKLTDEQETWLKPNAVQAYIDKFEDDEKPETAGARELQYYKQSLEIGRVT